MKFTKKELAWEIIRAMAIGIVVVALICLSLKWFRTGGYEWFGFKPTAEVLLGTAVTL